MKPVDKDSTATASGRRSQLERRLAVANYLGVVSCADGSGDVVIRIANELRMTRDAAINLAAWLVVVTDANYEQFAALAEEVAVFRHGALPECKVTSMDAGPWRGLEYKQCQYDTCEKAEGHEGEHGHLYPHDCYAQGCILRAGHEGAHQPARHPPRCGAGPAGQRCEKVAGHRGPHSHVVWPDAVRVLATDPGSRCASSECVFEQGHIGQHYATCSRPECSITGEHAHPVDEQPAICNMTGCVLTYGHAGAHVGVHDTTNNRGEE
jgi:hypothetical protein